MDLSTRYLGFDLPHPLVSGASPLVDDMDMVRRLEDAGAAAIVMHSLFEEQLVTDALGVSDNVDAHSESFAEAASMLPASVEFTLGPDAYLERIRQIREAVAVPVMASLNGTSLGGWLDHAQLIEEAGAHALELNLHGVPTDPEVTGREVEERLLDVIAAVKSRVAIPVAAKLSPFLSSPASFARQAAAAGADGLVLFNRFYQSDLDVEELEVERSLRLSDSSELLPRLRWLAILHGRVDCSLALTGGVHEPVDALKAVMVGAHAVQVVSALLRHGPERLAALREGLSRWLEEHEYESLSQARGSLSLLRCPDPAAHERANYVRMLQGYRG